MKEELKKIDRYAGKDTAKFKETYLSLRKNLKTEDELKQIDEYVEKALKKSAEKIDAFIEETTVRVQLLETADILPMAYIAKNYFHKTKAWLYQRINGNLVNGKPAKFTDEEIKTLNYALQDISKKIGSINIA